MSMQAAQGSLVILNAHTAAPEVFWNGQKIGGIRRVIVQNDDDDNRVKLVVCGQQDTLYLAMIEAGIEIKRVKK